MRWRGYWKRPVVLCLRQRWMWGHDYIQNYRSDWVHDIQQCFIRQNVDSEAWQTKHQPLEMDTVGLGPTWVPTGPGCSTFLCSQNRMCEHKHFAESFVGVSRLCCLVQRQGQRFKVNKTICTVRPYFLKYTDPELQPVPVSLFTPSRRCPFTPLLKCVSENSCM